jgi:hypothetical protein
MIQRPKTCPFCLGAMTYRKDLHLYRCVDCTAIDSPRKSCPHEAFEYREGYNKCLDCDYSIEIHELDVIQRLSEAYQEHKIEITLSKPPTGIWRGTESTGPR